jgi:hypothetical protein
VGFFHRVERERARVQARNNLSCSTSRVAWRRISPWCSRPSPVSIGNSVKTPE